MALLGFLGKDKKESLNKGLEKTKESVFHKLSRAVAGKSKVDEEVLDNLEEVLVSSDVGVGVDIGWNVFYDEIPAAEYTNKKLTYYGKQWRYSNHFPMLVAADYYVNPSEMIVPFVGLGVGTMYSLQNTDMGQYTFEKTAWHFVLRPEVGVIFNAASGVGFKISSKYYYGFKAGDLPAQGYATINVGFVFVQ